MFFGTVLKTAPFSVNISTNRHRIFGKWKELTGVQPLSNEGDEMIFRPDEDTDDKS